MGHQDRPHRAPRERSSERVAVAVQSRARIDDHDVPPSVGIAADDVRPGAVIGELRRVLGDHPPHERCDGLRCPVGETVAIQRQELHGVHSKGSIRPTSRP